LIVINDGEMKKIKNKEWQQREQQNNNQKSSTKKEGTASFSLAS
jgi:hypothetical protein